MKFGVECFIRDPTYPNACHSCTHIGVTLNVLDMKVTVAGFPNDACVPEVCSANKHTAALFPTDLGFDDL